MSNGIDFPEKWKTNILPILARRRKEIAEEELSDLILRIPSSVEATNMTRLLDPAFQPEFAYNKACTKEDEERVWSLMSF